MWDHYQPTVTMSTYLNAFVVSDFAVRESVDDGPIKFAIWARRELIDKAGYAADVSPKINRFFEDYLEIPYPLPKQVSYYTANIYTYRYLRPSRTSSFKNPLSPART